MTVNRPCYSTNPSKLTKIMLEDTSSPSLKKPQIFYSKDPIHDLQLTSNYIKSKMNPDTNSRSIDIPVPSTPPSHPRMKEKKYWKLSFRIVLIPFLFLGLPAHLPLMKKHIKNKNDWIKSHFNCGNIAITLLTLIIFIVSVALNIYVLRNIVEMFIILMIKGELNPSVVLNFLNLLQNLPIIITIDFIWIWGYVLRDLVLSFSRPSLSESFLQNPDLYHVGSDIYAQPGRGKLIIMNLLIVFIHTTHIYMYSDRAQEDHPELLDILVHFLNYFIGPVFSTLILPLYATFAWASRRHYEVLSNYVRSLINYREIPEILHFNRFKSAFKELSNRIQVLNAIFSIYLSWVIVNVIFSFYVEGWDLLQLFFTAMGKASEQPPETQPLLPPEVVRAFCGFIFIVFLKVGLLGFTIWQAVKVNDEARNLNVWLNDLVTEPNANMSVTNYHAFRLLKFYLHSRMQQPLPALLRIPITGCLPFLKNRLSPNFIEQY